MAALAVALTVTAGAASGEAFSCDSSTALTLVGLDTSAGLALLALPRPASGAGWLIAADLATGTAAAWPEPEASRRFGGSLGPGAPLAALRCGEQCLQPVAFRAGAWQPLGEALLAPATATVHLAWDRTGDAWVLLHEVASEVAPEVAPGVAPEAAPQGALRVLANRLQGSDWRPRGGLTVRGVGSVGAYPAPAGEAGVVVGDGVFAAAGEPRRWLAGRIPGVPGELLWLGGGRAVHLGADGALRETSDGGQRWQPLAWRPPQLGGGPAPAAAETNRHQHLIELPDGERQPPLLTVWTSQPPTGEPRLVVARQGAGGAWQPLADAPQGLLTESGERLAYNHLLRWGDHLALITGCVRRGDGAVLVLRTLDGTRLGPPQLVKVTPPAAGS